MADDSYAKKRREENKPDGVASQTLNYLKNGFMPTSERLKADEEYDRQQKRKKADAEKND